MSHSSQYQLEGNNPRRRISRYQPRLNRLQSLYEGNFRLLQHLLPSKMIEQQSVTYELGKQRFTLTILEETAYTLLVGLSLRSIYSVKQLNRYSANELEATQNLSEKSELTKPLNLSSLNFKSLNIKSFNAQALNPKPFNFQFATIYIRIYFDANLAEVISADKRSVLKGRYDYPNESLLQPDEKEQANQFLSDWLRACVLMGKVTD